MISIVSDFSAVNSELKKIEDERAKLRAEPGEIKSVAELESAVFATGGYFTIPVYQAPDDYLG